MTETPELLAEKLERAHRLYMGGAIDIRGYGAACSELSEAIVKALRPTAQSAVSDIAGSDAEKAALEIVRAYGKYSETPYDEISLANAIAKRFIAYEKQIQACRQPVVQGDNAEKPSDTIETGDIGFVAKLIKQHANRWHAARYIVAHFAAIRAQDRSTHLPDGMAMVPVDDLVSAAGLLIEHCPTEQAVIQRLQLHLRLAEAKVKR